MNKLIFGKKYSDEWCKHCKARYALQGSDSCERCLKKPYKPPRKAGPKWSGDSKYRQKEGMFQAKIGR